MTKSIAVFVTIIASLVTAAAAWDRGGTVFDKILLVSLSVVIVLAVHLLPAVSRRSVAWVVWFGCFLCAIYGHLTFFTHANLRAMSVAVKESEFSIGTDRQIQFTQESIDKIRARSVSVIAVDLAQATDKKIKFALREELAQSKKAEALRDQLLKLLASSTSLKSQEYDPVALRLASALGVGVDTVLVSVGLTFAILLELIGTLLWIEVFRPSAKIPERVMDTTPATTPVTTTDNLDTQSATLKNSLLESDDSLSQLRIAIAEGKCKGTVAGIRKFMKCSQTAAMEFRQKLA